MVTDPEPQIVSVPLVGQRQHQRQRALYLRPAECLAFSTLTRKVGDVGSSPLEKRDLRLTSSLA